ncbi:UbiA family prenyltransferase [Palleronia sediminis]|uniref:UbiA family prenyltransferase n=1 Tax=Palleronia sediminis TaxID=2547833 RepID=A0A4V3B8N6_9RHOB|nr:UbiA family prenyltransferase [Palleronia sediminis]TDL76309.1 UbiA family prenyltransferase [Palleronia sediminis]
MADPRPLVLDVDETFLKTDLLHESLCAGIGRAPGATLRSLARHWRRPDRLKAELAESVPLRVDLMPTRRGLAARARTAQSEGREVILASASDRRHVEALAAHHGFDGAMGSERGANLKGAAKARALVDRFGVGGFDYAGDSTADRAVWAKAGRALTVGADPRTDGPIERLPAERRAKDIVRALRPKSWVKNILLFLPAVAAHAFDWATFGLALLGIVAFSLAASSIYIVNDLLDLEADRLHPTKRNRPFASGAVSIRTGLVLFVAALGAALAVSAALGAAFTGVIVVYVALSLGYSLRLKRMRWVDLFCLAALYTLRVVAGAAATGVPATTAMLVFVFPVFFTLGCVKRLTELARASSPERLPGRGYGAADKPDLLNLAGMGVVAALAIFAIYTMSPQAEALYPSRWLLWAALPVMALWLMRMVALGARGRMDYDPIVFALQDRRGIGLLLITLSLIFWAAGLWSEWFG